MLYFTVKQMHCTYLILQGIQILGGRYLKLALVALLFPKSVSQIWHCWPSLSCSQTERVWIGLIDRHKNTSLPLCMWYTACALPFEHNFQLSNLTNGIRLSKQWITCRESHPCWSTVCNKYTYVHNVLHVA